MKKFYSILALVAVLCTSLFVATSCGEDEPEIRKNKIIVNAYYHYEQFSPGVLSQTTDKAVGDAMHAVQNRLGQIEFTTRDVAEKLLRETVDEEMNKLTDEVKYELVTKKAVLYFSVQKCDPAVEYIFDCCVLNAEAPKASFTIKSVSVYENFLANYSESTVAIIRELAQVLNTNLAGKSVEASVKDANNEVFAMAIKSLTDEQINAIKNCPEAADSGNRFLPLIAITYTSTYIGDKGQEQTVLMNIRSFEK